MERYVIHVTKECNCDCTYCYEKDKTSIYTIEELYDISDKIMDNVSLNTPFGIEFLGGEPMLEWEKIKLVFERFTNRAGKAAGKGIFVNAIITSNGTIMDEEILDYLLKNKHFLSISFSIDGNKFANQMRIFKGSRVNTFDKVMENIKLLISRGLAPMVHFTMSKYNVDHMFESVKMLYSKGVIYFGIGIVESTLVIDQEFSYRYIRQMYKISDWIKEENLQNNIFVSELTNLKPENDVRKYIKDANGRVLAETYGRINKDVTTNGVYDNVTVCSDQTAVSKMINHIRRTVYEYHNKK